MKGNQITITFKNDQVFILPNKPIPLAAIGYGNYKRTNREHVSWLITINRFENDTGELFADFSKNCFEEVPFTQEQLALENFLLKIEKIRFRKVPTNAVLNTFPSRTKQVVQNGEMQVNNESKEEFEEEENISFKIKITDITFNDGFVSFKQHRVGNLDKNVGFKIETPHIKSEFESVKKYFEKVYKRKTFNVQATLKHKGDTTTVLNVHSPEISEIGQGKIDQLKIEVLKGSIRNVVKEKPEELLTLDELFDEVPTTAFYEDETEFVTDMIAIKDSKHYQHLNYLSAKHDSKSTQLRFFLKPFSFLFLIEGVKKLHIVWETLNTKEATYVWSKDKLEISIEDFITEVQKELNEISQFGKIEYVERHIESVERVWHDYKLESFGFKK